MSTKYKCPEAVPSVELVARLRDLGAIVAKGPEAVRREFDMRVPAEADRDADIVLTEAARRIERLARALVELQTERDQALARAEAAEGERDACRKRECHALEVVAEYLDVLENAPDELTTDGLRGLFAPGNWSDVLSQRDTALAKLAACEAERDRLHALINTPETADFVKAVQLEAAHQRERWPAECDAGKTDADWFWLLGYLAGKALNAFRYDQNPEQFTKGLHHIITTAAACANWHHHRTVGSGMQSNLAEPARIFPLVANRTALEPTGKAPGAKP